LYGERTALSRFTHIFAFGPGASHTLFKETFVFRFVFKIPLLGFSIEPKADRLS